MSLLVKRLSERATLPFLASAGSAGYDLSRYAPIHPRTQCGMIPIISRAGTSAEQCEVPARGKALIKTDVAVAIPEGYYGRIGTVNLN